MKIHSSSLVFTPLANVKNNKSQGHNELLETAEISTDSQIPEQPDKDNNRVAEKINQLSDSINKQQPFSINSDTSRALNAYIQENTQPLKDQRTELVSGIDFFI